MDAAMAKGTDRAEDLVQGDVAQLTKDQTVQLILNILGTLGDAGLQVYQEAKDKVLAQSALLDQGQSVDAKTENQPSTTEIGQIRQKKPVKPQKKKKDFDMTKYISPYHVHSHKSLHT
jgi:hypothetical protein